jgi:hypothetical protein
MNSPHPTFSLLTRVLFAMVVFAIALTLLIKGASGPINAQQSEVAHERQIENTIPKHVPIAVKITKEKEKNWKDLKNENWARDFEIEITNTGDKPIYELELFLWFDVPNEAQDELLTDITYHNPGIRHNESIATADDIPIKPGESKRFTIQRGNLLAWDKLGREQHWRLPSKVRVEFQFLSFGDGTGFLGDKAAPYPVRPKTSQRSSFTHHAATFSASGLLEMDSSRSGNLISRRMGATAMDRSTAATLSFQNCGCGKIGTITASQNLWNCTPSTSLESKPYHWITRNRAEQMVWETSSGIPRK